MSAVAVAVGILAKDEAPDLGSTATKVLYILLVLPISGRDFLGKAYSVSVIDTSVENVRAGARSSRVIVRVSAGSGATAGETRKTPSCTRLVDIGVELYNGVFLDVVNLEDNVSNVSKLL